MNKTKETMARDYSKFQPSTKEGVHSSTQLENAFLAGFDAGQAQLLGQAASGFEEWLKNEPNKNKLPESRFERIAAGHSWQASALHSAKLLAEKDKELELAKELIKEMREALGFYANWCNMAGAQITESDTEIIHMINPLAKDSRGVLIGGKLARKTLKENTDKIKALLE